MEWRPNRDPWYLSSSYLAQLQRFDSKKSCNWVARKGTGIRCSIRNVRKKCPETSLRIWMIQFSRLKLFPWLVAHVAVAIINPALLQQPAFQLNTLLPSHPRAEMNQTGISIKQLMESNRKRWMVCLSPSYFPSFWQFHIGQSVSRLTSIWTWTKHSEICQSVTRPHLAQAFTRVPCVVYKKKSASLRAMSFDLLVSSAAPHPTLEAPSTWGWTFMFTSQPIKTLQAKRTVFRLWIIG